MAGASAFTFASVSAFCLMTSIAEEKERALSSISSDVIVEEEEEEEMEEEEEEVAIVTIKKLIVGRTVRTFILLRGERRQLTQTDDARF